MSLFRNQPPAGDAPTSRPRDPRRANVRLRKATPFRSFHRDQAETRQRLQEQLPGMRSAHTRSFGGDAAAAARYHLPPGGCEAAAAHATATAALSYEARADETESLAQVAHDDNVSAKRLRAEQVERLARSERAVAQPRQAQLDLRAARGGRGLGLSDLPPALLREEQQAVNDRAWHEDDDATLKTLDRLERNTRVRGGRFQEDDAVGRKFWETAHRADDPAALDRKMHGFVRNRVPGPRSAGGPKRIERVSVARAETSKGRPVARSKALTRALAGTAARWSSPTEEATTTNEPEALAANRGARGPPLPPAKATSLRGAVATGVQEEDNGLPATMADATLRPRPRPSAPPPTSGSRSGTVPQEEAPPAADGVRPRWRGSGGRNGFSPATATATARVVADEPAIHDDSAGKFGRPLFHRNRPLRDTGPRESPGPADERPLRPDETPRIRARLRGTVRQGMSSASASPLGDDNATPVGPGVGKAALRWQNPRAHVRKPPSQVVDPLVDAIGASDSGGRLRLRTSARGASVQTAPHTNEQADDGDTPRPTKAPLRFPPGGGKAFHAASSREHDTGDAAALFPNDREGQRLRLHRAPAARVASPTLRSSAQASEDDGTERLHEEDTVVPLGRPRAPGRELHSRVGERASPEATLEGTHPAAAAPRVQRPAPQSRALGRPATPEAPVVAADEPAQAHARLQRPACLSDRPAVDGTDPVEEGAGGALPLAPVGHVSAPRGTGSLHGGGRQQETEEANVDDTTTTFPRAPALGRTSGGHVVRENATEDPWASNTDVPEPAGRRPLRRAGTPSAAASARRLAVDDADCANDEMVRPGKAPPQASGVRSNTLIRHVPAAPEGDEPEGLVEDTAAALSFRPSQPAVETTTPSAVAVHQGRFRRRVEREEGHRQVSLQQAWASKASQDDGVDESQKSLPHTARPVVAFADTRGRHTLQRRVAAEGHTPRGVE